MEKLRKIDLSLPGIPNYADLVIRVGYNWIFSFSLFSLLFSFKDKSRDRCVILYSLVISGVTTGLVTNVTEFISVSIIRG
jgi:hypothetical protein